MKKNSILLIVLQTAFAISCATATQQLKIPPPVFSYRSPALDFTKAKGLCIMPLMAVRENPNEWEAQIAPILATSLTAAIRSQFSGWEVHGPDELLRYINEHNLVRGLQYFQADMAGGVVALPYEIGSVLQTRRPSIPEITATHFSSETLDFFGQLHKFCDLMLFVQYQVYLFIPEAEQGRRAPDIHRAVQVTASLFHPASGARARWWIGMFEASGYYTTIGGAEAKLVAKMFGQKEVPLDKLVELTAQSLSQNIGKGSLKNI